VLIGASLAPAILACTALCAGCATTAAIPDNIRVPRPVPLEIAERYCYEPGDLVVRQALRKQKSRWLIQDVEIDLHVAGDDAGPITLEYYQLPTSGPAPVALVLPILNGQKELVRPFATHFAKHGYAAVIVDTLQRKTLLEDLLHPEAAVRETIVRHRRVLDWIAAQPELDASRIVVFGASLGAFNALYLAAADSRIRAAATALVGGDLPYVLTHSNERRIIAAAEGAARELGTDMAGLAGHLEEHLETDTLSVAQHLYPERVLMIMATLDKTVPYDKQLELREALGNPEAVILPTGHKLSAAYIFQVRSRIRRFFDRVLASEGGSVADLPAVSCPP